MIDVNDAKSLSAHIGEVISAPAVPITDAMVDDFIALSGDDNAIHRQDAQHRTVPGNLLVVMVPRTVQACLRVYGARAVAASLEKVRFPNSLLVNTTVYPTVCIESVRAQGGGVFVSTDVVFKDADGQTVMTARTLDHYKDGQG
jgi:acyl dehydratase